MAEVLEEFSFNGSPNRDDGYPVRYEWDKWLNGQVWKLTQGEDFTISVSNFRNSAFVAAGKRDLKVRTTTNKADGTVVIQAMPQNT